MSETMDQPPTQTEAPGGLEPVAVQLQRARSFEVNEQLTMWVGEANGETARCSTTPDVTLYVKPIFEETCMGVALVDENGKVYADRMAFR